MWTTPGQANILFCFCVQKISWTVQYLHTQDTFIKRLFDQVEHVTEHKKNFLGSKSATVKDINIKKETHPEMTLTWKLATGLKKQSKFNKNKSHRFSGNFKTWLIMYF